VLAGAEGRDGKYIGSYTCRGQILRVKNQKPSNFGIDSRLEFVVDQNKEGLYVLTEYGGHLAIYDNPDDLKAGRPASLYAVFQGKSLPQNPNFVAHKYKNHMQFPKFNDAVDFGGESGVWGSLVVNSGLIENGGGKMYDAHYVFQAGDHRGGTIDYSCQAR
jgi:hypothetical protein